MFSLFVPGCKWNAFFFKGAKLVHWREKGRGLEITKGKKELKGRMRHSDVQRQLAVVVLNLGPEGPL